MQGDAAQLRGMYLAPSGLETALVTREELLRWREREADFKRWVDQATSRFTKVAAKVLPMSDDSGYVRRFVYFREVDGEWPGFSVGVRHPFDPHTTPIWSRVRRDEPLFAQMYARLKVSHPEAIESEGSLWLPIDVSEEVAGDAPVDHIESVTRAVFRAAIGDEG